MRIILIGAVESTAVTFKAMAAAGHSPVAIVSLESSLAHRHSDFVDMQPMAQTVGAEFIPVRSVNTPELVERINTLQPDWLVVVGWSQIVREPLLRAARLGAIGYHPSPLPELRGRAVLAWTILLGRTWTAGSLFTMEREVDSGRILAQRQFDLDSRETLATLMTKHMTALDQMWRDLLPTMTGGLPVGVMQDQARISHCAKRTAADGRIVWDQDVAAIDRLIRAVTMPYPGAFTHRGSDRLNVWEAEPWSGSVHYGLPGQVLDIRGDEVLVACRLGEALLIKRWSWAEPGKQKALAIANRLEPD